MKIRSATFFLEPRSGKESGKETVLPLSAMLAKKQRTMIKIIKDLDITDMRIFILYCLLLFPLSYVIAENGCYLNLVSKILYPF